MSIVTELVISVVGGVLTAAVLALFTRRGRGAAGHAAMSLSGRTNLAGAAPSSVISFASSLRFPAGSRSPFSVGGC